MLPESSIERVYVIEASNDADAEEFTNAIRYRPSGDFRGIVSRREGKIAAMVGYDYWTENAVQMHVWIPDFRALADRKFLRETFRFPFEIGNKGLAIAVTPAHNTTSLKFQKFLGFEEKYRIQDGWAIGDDMIISELKRSNCVWLRPPHDSRISGPEPSPSSG